jgi:hypothetical protein
MTGIFAQWQPRYAEHRIATFHVKDKRPCIRGWQKVGLPGRLSHLAKQFVNGLALLEFLHMLHLGGVVHHTAQTVEFVCQILVCRAALTQTRAC